jgi:hypothetical protein
MLALSDTFWFRFRTGESLKEPQNDMYSFSIELYEWPKYIMIQIYL